MYVVIIYLNMRQRVNGVVMGLGQIEGVKIHKDKINTEKLVQPPLIGGALRSPEARRRHEGGWVVS